MWERARWFGGVKYEYFKNLCLLPCIFIFVVLLMHGCAATMPTINRDSGLYEGVSAIDEDAVQMLDTKVDMKTFKLVLLIVDDSLPRGISVTDAGRYRRGVEDLVRNSLADMGFRRVLNLAELTNLTRSDPALASIEHADNLSAQKQISDMIGPILRIEVSTISFVDTVRTSYCLFVTDLSGNYKEYLRVVDKKIVWWNSLTEVYCPLLNELRKWVRLCSADSK
jgi:hypothetical protein